MSTDTTTTELSASVKRYAVYLMVMAGLGGLLYGIDVGVIAAALPYIEKTSTYTPSELSLVVAAVLAGSVLSSLFAGMLAEWLGRRKVIIISALLFTLSIPVICFSSGSFVMLMLGRILQGASAGLVGVVVPMYLAECLDANSRGKGTGMFQFMLTVGLVFAAVIGLVTTEIVGAAEDMTVSTESKQIAWQVIFWCSALPGIILFIGAFKLKESPRWLYRNGREDEALLSLAANNGDDAAREILQEMKESDAREAAEKAAMAEAAKGDRLLQRKYVIPFCLAVVVLACTQATGINSVLNYSVKIFQQAGLQGSFANWADLAIKLMNMLMTIVAVSLVDKKGRTFLLKMGTLGIIVGLAGVGCMFLSVENKRVDVTDIVKASVVNNALKVSAADVVKKAWSDAEVAKLHPEFMQGESVAPGMQLIVTYVHGRDMKQDVAEVSVDPKAEGTDIDVKHTIVDADPNFMDIIWGWISRQAPLAKGEVKEVEISRAEIGMKPNSFTGYMVAGFFVVFIAFYAAGPGVCVWLALSELMPNRIRANGMAIALLINQLVSTTIAARFLPWVGSSGYSSVFFWLAGFTVIYFITAAFFMPETKGRTLEEIEQYFTTGKMPSRKEDEAAEEEKEDTAQA
ncbi:MAG: MFS transporter [Akkermansia sp.]|nr:MFS transporter [Akkermansia sp.]